MSEVVNTIARQILALDPILFGQARARIQMDENTLRLHFKQRNGTYNIDISYAPGSDTYSIVAWQIKNLAAVKVYESKDIYFDSLPEIINGILNHSLSARGWHKQPELHADAAKKGHLTRRGY